jgi:ATP-dependent Clp protease adapter protein ClpS
MLIKHSTFDAKHEPSLCCSKSHRLRVDIKDDEVTRDHVVTYRLQTVFKTLSIYSFCRGDVQDCQHRLRA